MKDYERVTVYRDPETGEYFVPVKDLSEAFLFGRESTKEQEQKPTRVKKQKKKINRSKLVGVPTSVRIVRTIQEGVLNNFAIAKKIGVPNVSGHMAYLKRKGYISGGSGTYEVTSEGKKYIE